MLFLFRPTSQIYYFERYFHNIISLWKNIEPNWKCQNLMTFNSDNACKLTASKILLKCFKKRKHSTETVCNIAPSQLEKKTKQKFNEG